jgi:hypothetical protein
MRYTCNGATRYWFVVWWAGAGAHRAAKQSAFTMPLRFQFTLTDVLSSASYDISKGNTPKILDTLCAI